jgi:hypothetical protein
MISQQKIATFHKHVHYHFHGHGFDHLNKELNSSRMNLSTRSFREGMNSHNFRYAAI